jgi:hypothetical protein
MLPPRAGFPEIRAVRAASKPTASPNIPTAIVDFENLQRLRLMVNSSSYSYCLGIVL